MRHLTTALQHESVLQVGLLEFDFLGRSAGFRDGLEIDWSRVSTRPHRLLHRKVFNGLSAYTRLPVGRLVGLGRWDVVHGTYFERLPSVPRGGRGPVEVSTIHDVGFLRFPEFLARRNLAASRRALAEQLDRSAVVFTPSRFTGDELITLCGVDPARVVVTPLAASSPSVASPPAARLERRPYALYLGNVEPRKNVHALVKAWIAEGLGREYDLLVAGGALPGVEEYAEQLFASADLGVRYLGYVSDERREALFRSASCFVYPSQYEGFGLPVLEAMAAGTPVIISDARALIEVAGDAALVVSLQDLSALGPALRTVLDDLDVHASMVERGRRRAAEFHWSSTARATWRGYESAVAGR